MAIYFSSKNFKTAIIYSDADYENNGIYIYGNPDYLRSLAARIYKEKPNLGLLKKECIASFNDKKGCCLFLEMNDSINGRSPIDFKDELKEAHKYFKELTNSEYETEKFEYTTEQPDIVDVYFDERTTTFMVKILNWKHLEYSSKRKFIYAFLEVMSVSAGLKIVGDGGTSHKTDKKTFAIVVTSEGFGWKFAGTPKVELLEGLFDKYTQEVEKFTEEDANKYKISEQLINKINWLSSVDPFRW